MISELTAHPNMESLSTTVTADDNTNAHGHASKKTKHHQYQADTLVYTRVLHKMNNYYQHSQMHLIYRSLRACLTTDGRAFST